MEKVWVVSYVRVETPYTRVFSKREYAEAFDRGLAAAGNYSGLIREEIIDDGLGDP